MLALTLPLSLTGAPALSPTDCTDGNRSSEVTSLVADGLTLAAHLLKKPALPTGRWGADDSKKPKHEPLWLEKAAIEVIICLALAHRSPLHSYTIHAALVHYTRCTRTLYTLHSYTIHAALVHYTRCTRTLYTLHSYAIHSALIHYTLTYSLSIQIQRRLVMGLDRLSTA
jgi:hypothetical protein